MLERRRHGQPLAIDVLLKGGEQLTPHRTAELRKERNLIARRELVDAGPMALPSHPGVILDGRVLTFSMSLTHCSLLIWDVWSRQAGGVSLCGVLDR